MNLARVPDCLRLCAVFASLLLLASPAWALPDREVAGREAADAWLKLVDAGKYADSWQATAPIFRQSITRERWVELMRQIRAPLGQVESRKIKALLFTDSLPEAPPGQYVVVQFETKFSGQPGPAVETIVPMWDPESKAWEVSGYYINDPANPPQPEPVTPQEDLGPESIFQLQSPRSSASQ